MVSKSERRIDEVRLRAPVILMVLAATAIPVELRPLGHVTVDFGIQASEVVANMVAYVPVGIVLGEFGVLRAVIMAGLMSAVAESSQLVTLHRVCSAVDLGSNVVGALLGVVVSACWQIRSPSFRISKWKTLMAAILAFALIALMWIAAGPAPSSRGATSPGTLEAYWKLDETGGRVAFDSSGHGLNGRFSTEPERVRGVRGRAVMFDGANDYIDFGRSKALRLIGSMTISSWIKASFFPVDDAAIVSQLHGGFGYQLDTTVDQGTRTIGFKLTDACGHLMARYGATPLAVNTWYHVAGVYDAERRTLDVYLNGKLDNGPLVGSVTGTQHSSRSSVYVGKRSDLIGFEFGGSIKDVRIYSLALTNAEIATVMQGEAIADGVGARRVAGKSFNDSSGAGRPDPGSRCAVISEGGDERLPAVAAVLGVLVAFACIGLWPSASLLLYLFSSFSAGLLALLPMASTLPFFNRWMIPLVSIAGAASVVASVHRQNDLLVYHPSKLTPADNPLISGIIARDTLGVVCVLVLSGIFVAGLMPFEPPRNEVTWLDNEDGLRFGRYGTALSSGTFHVTNPQDEASCSLEIWLQSGLTSSSGTVLAFYTPENPLQLSVRQYRTLLTVTRQIKDGHPQVIGAADVFRQTQPVFIAITSGDQQTSIYVDGKLARAFPLFRLGDACTGRLVIGTSPVATESWMGQLKGLAIYKRELTAAEVLQHFETWTTKGRPDTTGADDPMALYRFDERAGNIAHDAAHRGIDLYIPGRFSLLHQPFLKPFWKEFEPRANYAIDILVNIGGFIPLGFFFCAYWSSVRAIRRPALATVALGFAVSLMIEVLQSYLPTRDSGTTDLIANTLGTFVGIKLCASKTANLCWRNSSEQ